MKFPTSVIPTSVIPERSTTPGITPGITRGIAQMLAVVLQTVGMVPVARRLRQSASGQSAEPATIQNEPVDTTRNFVLRVVQPGLTGLMDGSVSTLAPIFATAFATHDPFKAFLVGMASALGAGISMAFAEALSDDGSMTGRGNPWLRGGVTGLMTFAGGALHTLPFLIPQLRIALLAAYVVVAIELTVISMIRHRFFGTNWGLSISQVMGGGALVFAAAVILGNA
jgi:erythrin-vacuolar iron transport family protein